MTHFILKLIPNFLNIISLQFSLLFPSYSCHTICFQFYIYHNSNALIPTRRFWNFILGRTQQWVLIWCTMFSYTQNVFHKSKQMFCTWMTKACLVGIFKKWLIYVAFLYSIFFLNFSNKYIDHITNHVIIQSPT